MKKRFLSCLIVLTMLVSAIYMPVSASTGMLSKTGISGIVMYSNNTEKEYTNTKNQDVGGDLGKLTQHTIVTNLTPDTASDYYGALSFKVKADAGNMAEGSKDTFNFIFNNTMEKPDKLENNIFMMDYTGYMRAAGGTGSTTGIQYETGRYYTIGLVFRKDDTYDFYVDGQFKEKLTLTKSFKDKLPAIKLLLNVSNAGKFTVDDLTWSIFSNESFVAEGMGTTASAGDSFKIKFSNPVATLDSSKIKVFDCATGSELSGTNATLSGEYLEVTLPNNLEAGNEYRIELDGVTGAFGTIPATDNVYFSCPPNAETEDTIIYETFEGYTTKYRPGPEKAAGNTNYYQPEGWYLKQRWSNNAASTKGHIMPKEDDASHGTTMQIGSHEEDVGRVGAYLPFAEKVTSGKLSVSYDVKPEKLHPTGGTSEVPNSTLLLMAYPDHPTNYDAFTQAGDSSYITKSVIGNSASGRLVSGLLGLSLGRPTGDAWNTSTAARALWEPFKTFDAGVQTSASWDTMTVEFDFDKNIITWYFNGEKKATDPALMTTLELTNGISGISFGTMNKVANSSVLVDNVKVTRTYNSVLSNAKQIFEADFNSYGHTGDSPVAPAGWAMVKINATKGSTAKAATGEDGTTALKLGKKIDTTASQWDSPWLYHTLDKVYTDGVLSVSYDLKATALPTVGDSIQKLTELGVSSTNAWYQNWWPESFCFSVDPNTSTIIGETTELKAVDKAANPSKPVFGIQNKEFAAYVTNQKGRSTNDGSAIKLEDNNLYQYKANYRKAVTLNDTYSIKHVLDLNNDVVKTYIDDVFVSAVSAKTLGIEQIGGIYFGVGQFAYGTELLIDNVEVTHQQYQTLAKSVMQVRFSDYYDNTYGAASTLTTLADTVAVAFWTDEIDTPQETNFALVDENGHVIPFRGSYSLADKTYIMNLNEYLTKDTEYTLTVSGLTVGGNPLPNYTQVINSAVQGEVIVEPMYIMQGSEKKSSGALAENDTVTAGTRVINTTGNTETYSFFMALYDHGVLKMVDFREVEQDGVSNAENKEANISCSFTMSAEDASSITNIKAFLWDGFDTLGPVLPSIEFTNTAAE